MKTKQLVRKVEVDGREIEYLCHFKKVKNINLRVKPDRSIHVSMPSSVPVEHADRFVRSKSEFIFAALDKFERYVQPSMILQEGETICFLGKPYKIRVQKRSKIQAVLHFDAQEFHIFVKDPSDEKQKKKAVEDWQKFACSEIFPQILDRILPLFEKEGIARPSLRYRKMRSRWGSCLYSKKEITFSTMLIEAPLSAIEYVVVHELAHLIHPDHSKAFHALVESKMPDWKERKALLQRYYRISD